jgi:hypothetical protein
MSLKSQKNQKTEIKSDAAKSKKKSDEQKETNTDSERKGIIPEGMDFKKFMGCGG